MEDSESTKLSNAAVLNHTFHGDNEFYTVGCRDIELLQKFNYVLSKSISLGISICCICFRYYFIFTVKKIGYATRTKEYRRIKLLVFSISFFISGLLVLLMSANFSFSDKHFNGRFSDFNK